MSHPFVHPTAQALLQRVAQLFSSKKAFLRKDRHIVFVCGGPLQQKSSQRASNFASLIRRFCQRFCQSGTNNQTASLRSQFLTYADIHLDNFRLFLAEGASIDLLAYGEPQFLDLADFELLISGIADCIVLFPESAGSIAELGFFSHNDDIRSKILLVNDQRHQGSESFINLGPVHLIDRTSKFKPSIILDFNSSTLDFSPIRERLIRQIRSKTRKAFVFKPVDDMTPLEKFSVLLELVNIFQVVTAEHLDRILEIAFQAKPNSDELLKFISFLVSLELIERKGDRGQYFVMKRDVQSFLAFDNIDLNVIKTEVLAYYREHEPETYNSIAELIR